MKQAIIDIGSNSMRLTVYETEGLEFKILFREKNMAGLAGYVEDGFLTQEGIERACTGLLEFREILESLGIENCAVFATASLRNIRNTEATVRAIREAVGYEVEIISGEEEAFYGYSGAMQEAPMTSGAFVDIGGASTEVVAFDHGQVQAKTSFPVGSLQLYRECVKKILPGDGALKKIQKTIEGAIREKKQFHFEKYSPLVGVGGTSRAVLKLARRRFHLPADCNTITARQLYELHQFLCFGDEDEVVDLILKMEPDRIHTMIPGIMVLEHICRQFQSEEIIVCKYGVREGYLCHKILQQTEKSTSTLKTVN